MYRAGFRRRYGVSWELPPRRFLSVYGADRQMPILTGGWSACGILVPRSVKSAWLLLLPINHRHFDIRLDATKNFKRATKFGFPTPCYFLFFFPTGIVEQYDATRL